MHFILPLQYSNVSSGHFMLRSRHICRISSSIFETGNVTLTCLQSTVRHFYRAMLCIARTMLSQDVRPSARLSVTRHAGITSKRLKILFHLRVAIPFYFFPYQTLRQYSDGDPPNGTVECRGMKNRDFRPISRFISETIQVRGMECE